jgi:serine/threonine-protein kinase
LSTGRDLQEGRYEVIRRLGIGGQGAAYLAEDHRADVTSGHSSAKIVLKETILPVFVEPVIRQQALERFDQEAQILRTLDNDHIVKLIDYFVEDHRGYLVLEWVDGTPLRQVIENRGALPESQVRDLCLQMCEMLTYLHERSIIHRDFTPDNLILQKNGTLKLIDFNVAQQADESSTGIVVGKQAYMPAEQFRGKPVPQSDIYALGATLYFLLTGTDPEPISQSCVQEAKPQVSDQLDMVIKKCTEIDSKKRLSSAKEIAKLLGREEEANRDVTPAISTLAFKQGIKQAIKEDIKEGIENKNPAVRLEQLCEVESDG